jgi:hypothetical protein
MEILGIFLAILLAFAIVLLLRRAFEYRQHIPNYRVIRNILKRKKAVKPEPGTRMFAAIRRRRSARTDLLTLEDHDYRTFILRITAQVQQLNAEWANIAKFECGFHGSDYGLPSTGEENWLLFASYIVPDYAAYRACLAVLESDRFLLLRNHCEIRLLYGEKMTDLTAHINELF